MARSHGIIKTTVWESGSEYRALKVHAQWAYAMLVSQPQINNCGVLLYVPEKWVRFAADLDRDGLQGALLELRRRLFIVVDEETGELLVRTFIKHDRIWKQPNLVTAARREYSAIESQLLREILAHQHGWLINNAPADAVRSAEESSQPKGLTEPLIEGVNEGLPEGVAYARDAGAHAHPRPLPQTTLPQGESSSGTNRSDARATSAGAGRAQTNGTHRPAIDVAIDFLRNAGAEIPASDLQANVRAALTDAQGHHCRADELDDDDWITLTELHHDLQEATT